LALNNLDDYTLLAFPNGRDSYGAVWIMSALKKRLHFLQSGCEGNGKQSKKKY
jgi:hypothetical protein